MTRSSYDAIIAAFGELARRNAPTNLRPIRAAPWFATTPQDRSIHAGRISTKLATDDGRAQRAERRWRVIEEPPPSDTPSFAELLLHDGPRPG